MSAIIKLLDIVKRLHLLLAGLPIVPCLFAFKVVENVLKMLSGLLKVALFGEDANSSSQCTKFKVAGLPMRLGTEGFEPFCSFYKRHMVPSITIAFMFN